MGVKDSDPIADDEFLYRRIPVSKNWFDPVISDHPSPAAFDPREEDVTGLSACRESFYQSVSAAANGPSKKGYWVAILRAGDIRLNGIEVVPRPSDKVPGHVEFPGIRFDNKADPTVEGWKVLLARKLCLRVEGPFHAATA